MEKQVVQTTLNLKVLKKKMTKARLKKSKKRCHQLGVKLYEPPISYLIMLNSHKGIIKFAKFIEILRIYITTFSQ